MRHRTRLVAALSVVGVFACVSLVASTGYAAAPVIQPGVSLDFGGSFCTMNWVYDGTGGPYVGAAGHCTTGVGQSVQLATHSLGSPIETIGTVAFVSPDLDYCLIRVSSGVVRQLYAGMVGHPKIPHGVSTPSTAKRGNLIQFSGHGVGFDLIKPTQRDRLGIFDFFSAGYQYVIGPVTPGDSGGPVGDITDGNKAIGIVDTVGVTIALPGGGVNIGEGGVAVYALLADAAAHGFSIRVRTV